MNIQMMQRAMALAEKARFLAPPNPWVGCVIVNRDQIVGEGYTQPPGEAHAEICALQSAGEVRGADLYVTLEPCAHVGKTPPCTHAIIQAGIKKVYFGVSDPDPRVNGKGAEELRKAGIEVIPHICEKEIAGSLAPYLHHRQKQLPYTIVKAAISIDGRMAAADHTSQWLTGREAHEDTHLERALSQAIVIGSETALKDRPNLTVRHINFTLPRQPLRVLLDSKGRVPAEGALFDPTLAPTLVITTEESSEQRRWEWQAAGAQVALVSKCLAGIDLKEAWEYLGKQGILQVLVEGGATLHTSLLQSSLINRLLIYIGPLLLGSSGFPLYQKNLDTLKEAYRLNLLDVKKVGDSVRLDYAPL